MDHTESDLSAVRAELQPEDESAPSHPFWSLENFPSLEESADKLRKSIEQLKQREDEIKKQLLNLQEVFENGSSEMANTRTLSELDVCLQKAKEQGKLPGLYGRLGDMGSIDAKYDIAISTCFEALDYYVVDTIETGEKAVELLKQENVGWGTFLVRDKQKYLEEMSKAKPKPNKWGLPRLFDLVKCEGDVSRLAFYSMLQNTLVADDIETAVEISKEYEEKVITLKGESVGIRGEMSGGGKVRGKINVTGNIDDVEKKDIERTDGEIKALQEELQPLMEELGKKQLELTDVEVKLGEEQRAPSEKQADVEALQEELQPLMEELGKKQLELTDVEVKLGEEQRAPSEKQADVEPLEEEVKNRKRMVGEAEGESPQSQSAINMSDQSAINMAEKEFKRARESADDE